MNTSKRHHYLPRFYLEGFSNTNILYVYDRKDDQYRKQTPLNTAIQKHYYTIDQKDGKKNIEIEKMLSQLEGNTKKVINNIMLRRTLSNTDKTIMSLFISFQWTRIPDFECMVNESMRSNIKKIGDILHKDVNRIKQTIQSYEKDTRDKIEIEAAKLKEFWDRGNFDIVINRNASLDMMLKIAPECARFLSIMDWVLAIAPKGYSFITTDSPFVLVPSSDEKVKGVFQNSVGLLISGVRKFFPISQKVCVVIGDLGDKTQYAKYNKSLCKSINAKLARHAKRFIIARDQELLKSLVKEEKLDQRQRGDLFRIQEFGPFQILQNTPIEKLKR